MSAAPTATPSRSPSGGATATTMASAHIDRLRHKLEEYSSAINDALHHIEVTTTTPTAAGSTAPPDAATAAGAFAAFPSASSVLGGGRAFAVPREADLTDAYHRSWLRRQDGSELGTTRRDPLTPPTLPPRAAGHASPPVATEAVPKTQAAREGSIGDDFVEVRVESMDRQSGTVRGHEGAAHRNESSHDESDEGYEPPADEREEEEREEGADSDSSAEHGLFDEDDDEQREGDGDEDESDNEDDDDAAYRPSPERRAEEDRGPLLNPRDESFVALERQKREARRCAETVSGLIDVMDMLDHRVYSAPTTTVPLAFCTGTGALESQKRAQRERTELWATIIESDRLYNMRAKAVGMQIDDLYVRAQRNSIALEDLKLEWSVVEDRFRPFRTVERMEEHVTQQHAELNKLVERMSDLALLVDKRTRHVGDLEREALNRRLAVEKREGELAVRNKEQDDKEAALRSSEVELQQREHKVADWLRVLEEQNMRVSTREQRCHELTIELSAMEAKENHRTIFATSSSGNGKPTAVGQGSHGSVPGSRGGGYQPQATPFATSARFANLGFTHASVVDGTGGRGGGVPGMAPRSNGPSSASSRFVVGSSGTDDDGEGDVDGPPVGAGPARPFAAGQSKATVRGAGWGVDREEIDLSED